MTLDSDTRNLLRSLAARIIPADVRLGLPGADDEAIFARILTALEGDLDAVRASIPALAAERAAELPAGDLDTIAQALVGEEAPCLAFVIPAVAQAYYTDPRILASLGVELRPPFPRGFSVDEGDWSLVEPVRRRGRMWRDAS